MTLPHIPDIGAAILCWSLHFWNKSMRCSDQALELQHQGPTYTPARVNHEQGLPVNRDITWSFCCISVIRMPKMTETIFGKKMFFIFYSVDVYNGLPSLRCLINMGPEPGMYSATPDRT